LQKAPAGQDQQRSRQATGGIDVLMVGCRMGSPAQTLMMRGTAADSIKAIYPRGKLVTSLGF